KLNAAFYAPFMLDLFDSDYGFVTPPRPFIPGMDAIGTIDALGEGVDGLKIGARVYVDVYCEGGGEPGTDDRCFIGNFAVGADSESVLARWPNGVFAEYIVAPADCAVPIPSAVKASDADLTRLGWLGTAYAAAMNAGVRPGAVWAVNGATGVLGASAVAVARALEARKIYVFGRRREVLESLCAIDPRIEAARPGETDPIDLAVTAMEGDDPASIEAVLGGLARGGRLVAVSSAPLKPRISLDMLVYGENAVLGSLWFDRHRQLPDLFDLLADGRLDLSPFKPRTFPLSSIDKASDAVAARPGGLEHIVINCQE
ncbi:MAG: alcohol dehydrogenase catalytic domain-containing protein, partial [Pseudomonadota bacterium]